MKALSFIPLAAFVFMTVAGGAAQAASQPFEVWLKELRREAAGQGISQKTLSAMLPDTLQPIPRILELDRKQPEGTTKFEDYLGRIVDKARIETGQTRFLNNRQKLIEIGNLYGVDPQFIVALWGVETNYGRNTGGYDVVNALATLAYDGRRGAYFRGELMKALKIADEGHVNPNDFKGSWAGAMGQVQFMPTSFYNFAVDHNGDGRRDIWGTQVDAFASAANYLAKSGWNKGQPWGREVIVPASVQRDIIGLDNRYPVRFWRDLGVRQVNGQPLQDDGAGQASLIQPDGPGTRAFIVYDNYRVILKWNRSNYFASSVGLLADAVKR